MFGALCDERGEVGVYASSARLEELTQRDEFPGPARGSGQNLGNSCRSRAAVAGAVSAQAWRKPRS
ncbi:hypothetical protein GCM10010416_42440 [Streptomyces caniferus]